MNTKLRTLLVINSLIIISGNLLGPLYAVFVSTLDATAFQVSLTWATMLISGIITAVIVSRLPGDSNSRNLNLIIAGYLIVALSWLAYIAVDNIAQLLVIQAFLGVGLSIGMAPFNSLFAEHLDRGKHTHDYADQQILSQVIQFVAVLVGGALLTWFGFNVLFMVMALLAIFPAILMLSLPKNYFGAKS